MIKKRIMQILLINLMISINAFAQNQSSVDSLERMLDRAGNDSTRSHFYLAIAEKLEKGPGVFHYATLALQAGARMKNNRIMGRAFLQTGYYYTSEWDQKLAIAAFRKSIPLAKAAGDFKTAMKAYAGICRNSGVLYRFKDAMTAADEGLRLARVYNESEEQALLLKWKRMAASFCGDQMEAMESTRKLLELQQKRKDEFGIAEALQFLGGSYSGKGESVKAMENYQQALKIFEKTENWESAAWAGLELGALYHAWGQLRKAQEFYRLGLKRLEKLNNPGRQAIYLNSIARNFLRNNDLVMYARYKQKAIENFGNTSDTEAEGIKEEEMADFYTQKGDFNRAIACFRKAIDIYVREEEQENEAYARADLSETYLKSGKPDSALVQILSVKPIAEKLGADEDKSDLWFLTGQIYLAKNMIQNADACFRKSMALMHQDNENPGYLYFKTGREYLKAKNFPKVIHYLTSYLKSAEEQGTTDIQINTHWYLGQAYTQVKQTNNAEKHLKKAMSLAQHTGFLKEIAGISQSLYVLYKTSGNMEKALEMHELFHEMDDSMKSVQTRQEISEAEATSEFERKEAGLNASFQNEVNQHLSELRRQRTMRNAILGGTGLAAAFSLLLVRSHNRRKKTAFEKKVTDVEMKALRAQMDPHFIHNSLLSIDQYLRGRDEKTSSRYLQKFSRLMRMILEHSRKDQVLLSDDLEALQLYMEMENLRMERPVTVNITWDEKVNPDHVLIQPMLIQPFVENAFKHAFSGIAGPKLDIVISLDEPMLRVTITDNGRGRRQKQEMALEGTPVRQSLGLKVTEERLEVISRLKKIRAFFTFEDLKDQENNPAGTRVVMKVPAAFAY